MVSKGDEKFVIWPTYFNKSVARFNGRKVSLKYAVEKPNIDDIYKVAKALGLNPVIEKNVAHPYRPWLDEGRILVDKKEAKSKILVKIASKLK
ncbi:MAG TPA: signal recognition particle subunit SRP19/SEC65 family protein [Candidatus Lokiarchaeia archaeon]